MLPFSAVFVVLDNALSMAILHAAPGVQTVAPMAPIETGGVLFEPLEQNLPCFLGQTRRRGHECVETAACQTERDHRLRGEVREDERDDLRRKGDCNALRRQSLGGENVPQKRDGMALRRRSLGGGKLRLQGDSMALRRRCLGREDPTCRETYLPQNAMQEAPNPGEHGWGRRISTKKARREETSKETRKEKRRRNERRREASEAMKRLIIGRGFLCKRYLLGNSYVMSLSSLLHNNGSSSNLSTFSGRYHESHQVPITCSSFNPEQVETDRTTAEGRIEYLYFYRNHGKPMRQSAVLELRSCSCLFTPAL